MAIRYSGDVDVRLGWDPKERRFVGLVRSPSLRWHVTVRRSPLRFGRDIEPTEYDNAAKKMITRAEREIAKRKRLTLAKVRERYLPYEQNAYGGPKVRRVFQAPCPSNHPPVSFRRT